MTAQYYTIYTHLLEHGSITTREAFDLYGCAGVGKIIKQIEQNGAVIRRSKERYTCKNKMQTYVTKYTLERSGENAE